MATKTVHTFIARGTQKSSFTQLVANAVTTRSGTTATLTMASTATLATNDWCLIQGHDIEEYNGVFQITVASGTAITYSIFQDPGASSSVTNASVDKVIIGTALDLTTADYGEAEIVIQNGGTGPSTAPEVWQGVSTDVAAYRWRPMAAGTTTAKDMRSFIDAFPPGRMYVNYAIGKNAGQNIDCYAIGSKYVG